MRPSPVSELFRFPVAKNDSTAAVMLPARVIAFSMISSKNRHQVTEQNIPVTHFGMIADIISQALSIVKSQNKNDSTLNNKQHSNLCCEKKHNLQITGNGKIISRHTIVMTRHVLRC
jgi:hypothetical protein